MRYFDSLGAIRRTQQAGTTDTSEIERFAGLAEDWWDLDGPMRPLHKYNPLRMRFISEEICEAYDRDPKKLRALDEISVLDIGCGGGLLSEPLTRMGARVTGIDLSTPLLEVARSHAYGQGLEIDYQSASVEAFAEQGLAYDVVIASEVIEHVAEWEDFLSDVALLVKPGGVLIVTTINRTRQSFVLAKVAVEYVLGWLPRGTHDWRKFRKPSELARVLRFSGLRITSIKGARYLPAFDRFEFTDTPRVNYMLSARR